MKLNLSEMAYKAPTLTNTPEQDAIAFARKNCMDTCKYMLQTGGLIYRGTTMPDGEFIYHHVAADMSGRESKNTANYYTLMMDNFESWADYPKRSQSFICTNSDSKAARYGTHSYVFIPVDGTIIARAPFSDIWKCFPKLEVPYDLDTLNDLDWFINTLSILLLGDGHTSLPDVQWAAYKKRMNVLSRMLQTLTKADLLTIQKDEASLYQPPVDFLLKAKAAYGDDLLALFEALMLPEKNGFKQGTIQAMVISKNKSAESHELWFSGEALIIPAEVIQTFLISVVTGDQQAEAVFVQGRFLTEGYAYQYTGDYTMKSGAGTGVSFDDTDVGKLVNGATDITSEEFLLRADVPLMTKLKIKKDEAAFEYMFNKEYNVLILYDSTAAVYQFFMAK